MEPEKKNVIWQFTQRGFGSEVCLMLLAWLYCLDKNMNFYLSSRHSNIAYQLGWQDYFEPFCDEIDHWSLQFELRRARHCFRKWIVKNIQHVFIGTRFLNCPDIMPEFMSHEFLGKLFKLPQFGMENGTAYDACRILFHKAYHMNHPTQQAVEKRLSELSLPAAGYATVHIRRGDKIKESPMCPIEDYLAKVRAVNPTVRHVFVMTDDFSVVESIRETHKEWVVYTLCQPSSRGHLQRDFNRKTRETRRVETIQLLAEIEIATRSLFYVGTCSSNIARLIGVYKNHDFVYGVDGEDVTEFWVGKGNPIISYHDADQKPDESDVLEVNLN
jgi:hypothetical protein